jgi:hypothetical protein
MIRNEASIRQWASLIMDKEISNLKDIQNIKFVKDLLYKIDWDYFSILFAPNPKLYDSYPEVLNLISRYFLEVIGTNIKEHIDGINAYKNVMEVWELLLGMAIKGSKRDENISLIFEMDPNLQA